MRWLSTLQVDVGCQSIDSAFLQPDYTASAKCGFKTCLVLVNVTLPKQTTELLRQGEWHWMFPVHAWAA